MAQPPTFQTQIFNSSFFSANSESLTIEKADQRYLSLGGGSIGGSLSIAGDLTVGGNAVVPPPAYVVGISPGTAANNKALVLGASGDIGTISSLTATNIYGTLQTATQPNITSLGTLTGLTIGGNLNFTGSSRTLTGLSSISVTSISATLTTADQIDIINAINPSVSSAMNAYGLLIRKSTSNAGDSVGLTFGITSNSIASATGGSSIAFTRTGSNGIGYLTVNHRLSTTTAGALTEIIRIDQTGDVSISNGNLTVDSTKKINGFLGYANQPVISTVGALTELGIGSGTLASTEYLRITGDGTNYLDGNYTRCCLFQGPNTTPLQFQIEVHNGTRSTSTNSTWLGNITANDLRFGTNNTTYMILNSAGRVGIGTTSPANSVLDVSGSVSQTIDAAGLGYGALTKSQTTFTIGPLASIAVSIRSSNSILVSAGSYITTSDRRLKTNIEDITDTTEFVRNVNPKLFSYRSTPNKRELGYIAQDVAKHSIECISFIENESLKAEQDGDINGVQLTLDYPKIACLLHKCLQGVLDRLDKLTLRLDGIADSRTATATPP